MRIGAVMAWLGTLAKGSKKVGSILTPYLHFRPSEFKHSHSPAQKLFRRYSAVVAVLFLIGVYTPSGLSTSAFSFGDAEGLWAEGTIETPYMADQEGYLTKINPQTSSGDRTNVNDFLVHTVAAGENISTIASSYSLKQSTLMWSNNIGSESILRVGQKLYVPPLDGVSHRIAKGDNIDKISKAYGIGKDLIIKQNSLSTEGTIALGEEIFIPGAKPLVTEAPVRNTVARVASSSRVSSLAEGTILDRSNDAPIGDKPFIFPTRGKLTQGFHAGHYAYDIGNADRPAIWSAGSGKVVKIVSGCADVSYRCGGGYGNHVIIDHGNGLQTLYAHMTYSTVQEGEEVSQGQVIGKMGRTGNVRGKTGIHLHFEVRMNGVKQVPSKYY